MSERPTERAARLAQEVLDADKATYTKGEVRQILSAISGMSLAEDSYSSVSRLQRGDVFVASALGAKVRPWIVLSVKGDVVVAVALSSGDKAPNMQKSRCRYWESGWIGVTITQFRHEDARKLVTRPYSNKTHLLEVEKTIADQLGLKQKARRPKRKAPNLRRVA